MDTMGDKINAREQMIKAGVPLSLALMVKFIRLKRPRQLQKKIGYPVMLRHRQVVVEKGFVRLKRQKTWSQL